MSQYFSGNRFAWGFGLRNVWFQAGAGPFKEPGMIWLNSGTWEIDTAKYPSGFRPFTDWIHARGMQFVLWFEPERVGDPNSWLGKNHPEWLLPGTSHGALLDEGKPEARKWLTEHVSGMIKSQGIDWYREDMNDGVVQAFRRAQSAEEMARYKLRGLDPQARYAVTNLDAGEVQTLAGCELMDDGLPVAIRTQPGAIVLIYTQLK